MKNENCTDSPTVLERRIRADYFGVEVEVVVVMSHCSSIRYRNREFVVLTQDLLPIGYRHWSAAA